MVSWQSRIHNNILKLSKLRRFNPRVAADKMRAGGDKAMARFSKVPANVKVIPIETGRTKAEWIEPPNAQQHRVILYLHGGGYCIGSPDTHRGLVARLCEQASARGLLVDYRLAPENKFPAAIEDALDAYQWLLGQGIDPKGIVIAGDSAGGGLAIATCMALRDASATQPAAIVAMSPWTDLALTGWSMLTLAKEDPFMTPEMLGLFARHYLQGKSPTQPLASPLYGDFRGLPPMMIHVGANEILRDDATRLTQKAEASGTDISVEVWDGMPHIFQIFNWLPESKGSLARFGSFIKTRTVAVPMRRAAQ
ncbi:MAG: alpha/beta hydrolase [Alphaproteobacteria bacterium]|nr:MAG: alpha/beta hydrolase [Alphaproteobacteria bacterium]